VINEIPTQESSISGVLRYCKLRLLHPYLKFLAFIGLKPLSSDTPDLNICQILINKLYIGLVIIILVVGYGLQCLTCFR